MRELPFEFPPGHTLLISKFVAGIKKTVDLQAKPAKKIKLRTQVHAETVSEDVSSTVNSIRQNVMQWMKRNNTTLEENIDYTIVVTKSVKNELECDAAIRCRCKQSIAVQRRPSGQNKWNTCNWARHVSACFKKKTATDKGKGKQGSLKEHFKTSQPQSLATQTISDSSCITTKNSSIAITNNKHTNFTY